MMQEKIKLSALVVLMPQLEDNQLKVNHLLLSPLVEVVKLLHKLVNSHKWEEVVQLLLVKQLVV